MEATGVPVTREMGRENVRPMLGCTADLRLVCEIYKRWIHRNRSAKGDSEGKSERREDAGHRKWAQEDAGQSEDRC